MRFPAPCDQMSQTIETQLPCLRPVAARGLALWVYGTIRAGSACHNAVVTALSVQGNWPRVRELAADPGVALRWRAESSAVPDTDRGRGLLCAAVALGLDALGRRRDDPRA